MRRKDGKPQIRALRHKAVFQCGFKDSQNARANHFNEEVRPYTTQRNLTLIGNAVPPVLAHAVAKSVARFISAIDNGENDSRCVAKRRHYTPAKTGVQFSRKVEF